MNKISTQPVATDTLNRILRILCRSLPRYLEDARPWSAGDDQPARAALSRLVADQRWFARRTAEVLCALGGQPELGPFPIEFTSLNDVSLEYLLPKILEQLQRDVESVGRCVTELADAPEARILAEEVLGNLQGHADSLGEVTGER